MVIAREDEGVSTVVVHVDRALLADLEAYSEMDGVSLDRLIGLASADLVRRRKEEEWFLKARHSTPEGRAQAIAVLERVGTDLPDAEDQIPASYLAWRRDQISGA